MKRVLVRVLFSAIVLLLTGAPAWAQAGATAQISGIVKDGSGGVLPGVDVSVTQTDTGQKRNAISGCGVHLQAMYRPPTWRRIGGSTYSGSKLRNWKQLRCFDFETVRRT